MAIEKVAKAPFILTHADGWTLTVSPGDDVVLGRGADTANPIPHIATDRRHARVRFGGLECTIEDLKSTSGTWVNGTIVHEPQPLAAGDVIRIGAFEVTVTRAER